MREAEFGVNLVSLVATALARVDAAAFKTVLLGGAPAPEVTAVNVVTTYGMTETCGGVVYDGVPLDGVEVAVSDDGTGAPGEILLRGPMLLRAYRDGSDPLGPGGWLPTGDAGTIDEQGLLLVAGRIADTINTGGEKVWPESVEKVLSGHRLIAEVLVGSRPDPEWGQRVVAFVVPADPAMPPLLDELRERVTERLAPWAAPRELVIMDALPRTASGKLARRLLGQLPPT
jgi:O-succinylbenzoic acid--CoA ligase